MQENTRCHFDPQLVNYQNEQNFVASLGQCDAAQGVLGSRIDVGDVFLFFGRFQHVEKDEKPEKYKYVKYSDWKRPFHCIWGYMQVGEAIPVVNLESYEKYQSLSSEKLLSYEEYKYLKEHHPHANYCDYKDNKNNTIYIASENFTFDKIKIQGKVKGYGTFKFHDSLILTETDINKNERKYINIWRFNKSIGQNDPKVLTYQSANQSANCLMVNKIGQELVVDPEGTNSYAREYFTNLLRTAMQHRVQ